MRDLAQNIRNVDQLAFKVIIIIIGRNLTHYDFVLEQVQFGIDKLMREMLIQARLIVNIYERYLITHDLDTLKQLSGLKIVE